MTAPSKYTYDMPPGTDRLDEDGKEHSVHYPMPSGSLHDPLVWKKSYKTITYWLMIVWTFVATLPLIAVSSIYGTLIKEYGMPPTEISQVGAWNNLALAFAGFVLLPYASAYGRRPMLLVSNLVYIAGVIWVTQTHTPRQFLWSRNLNNVGAGAIEVIGLCLTGDLFFTQQAGKYHALGFLPLIIATNIGSPILGAFDQHGIGWRNFFWMCAGLAIALEVAMFFFLSETLWHRTNASARGHVVEKVGASTDVDQDSLDDEAQKHAESRTEDVAESTLTVEQAAIIANVGKGYPSKQQRFSVFPPRNKNYSIIQNFRDILTLSTFVPVALFSLWWAAIGGSATAQGYVAAQIWAAPPYLFKPSEVGMTNIPPTIGILFGLLIAGPVVDWDVARQAKRNGGVREPEMRLRVAIGGGLVCILGLMIYGVGLQNQWHWAAVLIPGMGLNQFAGAFVIAAASSYATDVYKQFPIEIAFITTIVKNLWVFALGYFINNLYTNDGALKCITIVSIPLFVAVLATVACLWVGKPARRFSARFAIMQRE